MRRWLVVVSVVAMTAQAQGQKTPEPRAPAPRELRFDEGDVVDGSLATPDVELVRPAHVTAAKPKLIRVRADFRERVLQSVSEL